MFRFRWSVYEMQNDFENQIFQSRIWVNSYHHVIDGSLWFRELKTLVPGHTAGLVAAVVWMMSVSQKSSFPGRCYWEMMWNLLEWDLVRVLRSLGGIPWKGLWYLSVFFFHLASWLVKWEAFSTMYLPLLLSSIPTRSPKQWSWTRTFKIMSQNEAFFLCKLIISSISL